MVVSGGKFHFLPIRDDLKKHNYDESKLEFSEDGEVTYNDGTVSSIKGVDVSQYQGNIDWDRSRLTALNLLSSVQVTEDIRQVNLRGMIWPSITFKGRIKQE